MRWIRRYLAHFAYLWRMALNENASPVAFGRAVAIGVFVSASPVPPVGGLRSFSTIGLAWLTRSNRLAAWLASHSVLLPLWPLLALWEVRLGCAILRLPPPQWGNALQDWSNIGWRMFGALWLGGMIVAPLCALVAFAIAWRASHVFQARKAAATKLPLQVPATRAPTPAE